MSGGKRPRSDTARPVERAHARTSAAVGDGAAGGLTVSVASTGMPKRSTMACSVSAQAYAAAR